MIRMSTVVGRARALTRRAWRRTSVDLLALTGAVVLVLPANAGAALQAAASGGQHGSAGSGFSVFKSYFDKITTYLVYLAVPATVLMLIGVAFALQGGHPRAHSFGARVVIGFALVLAAKGIAA
jgi:hypothetical protein